MKLFRLNRLFNAQSQRCFDVAIDHGFFNELGFLGGIENLPKAVETLVGANPEAIQLTVGQAEVLQRILGKQKPAWVLRTDVANVYGRVLPRALFSRMIEQAVQQAIRLDATCVVVNLFQIPEQPEAPTNASRTSSDSSRSATGTRFALSLGSMCRSRRSRGASSRSVSQMSSSKCGGFYDGTRGRPRQPLWVRDARRGGSKPPHFCGGPSSQTRGETCQA